MEENLPPSSWQLEMLRRTLLDHYREQGYELVFPPLVEHLNALLTGSAIGLEQQTFKFADPESGRMLGIRADMTPQAARIAARRYDDGQEIRLCYLGTVLRTQADSPGGPRSPRQVGCELFGSSGPQADLEVLCLMLRTLSLAGVEDVHIDLGHVAIYQSVIEALSLEREDELRLFDILQRKSHPDLSQFVSELGIADQTALLTALIDMHGDASILADARARFGGLSERAAEALDKLEAVSQFLASEFPQVPVHLDLAELRGLTYHTGLVFAAFVPGYGRDIARGGRYNGVGREFGRAMPATGFSADLNELLRLGKACG